MFGISRVFPRFLPVVFVQWVPIDDIEDKSLLKSQTLVHTLDQLSCMKCAISICNTLWVCHNLFPQYKYVYKSSDFLFCGGGEAYAVVLCSCWLACEVWRQRNKNRVDFSIKAKIEQEYPNREWHSAQIAENWRLTLTFRANVSVIDDHLQAPLTIQSLKCVLFWRLKKNLVCLCRDALKWKIIMKRTIWYDSNMAESFISGDFLIISLVFSAYNAILVANENVYLIHSRVAEEH